MPHLRPAATIPAVSSAVSCAALAGALLAASPAAAERLATTDATEDVWQLQEDASWSAVEGSRVDVDVVSSTVRHTDRRVRARVDYADLVRNTDTSTAVVRVRTSGAETYLLQLSTGPGNREGTVVLGRYTEDGLADVECDSVGHSVSYADDRLVMSVPRSCLGRPTWVRYGGEAVAVEEGPGAVYSDALLSGDPVNDLWSARIERG